MNWFPQSTLNEGVRKREVFGWAMYDFANSGYTTVVLTAVFNVYFIGYLHGAVIAWIDKTLPPSLLPAPVPSG